MGQGIPGWWRPITRRSWVFGLLAVLLCSGAVPGASAQVAPDRVRAAQAGAEPSFGTGRVRIQAVRLGLGERVRPGSWAGVLVEFQNQGDREIEVLLRVEIPDADGDRALYERVLAANPGVRQSAWLYARLPHALQAGSGVVVSAHEAIEAGFGETPTGFRAGDLYDRRIAVSPPAGQVSSGTGMMGVLGRFPIGLGTLGERPPGQSSDHLPQGHERTEVIGQLRAQDLPDRWLGLESFHTLIWAGEPPSELRADAGEAVAEWIARGGHMIVILPPVGQEWVSRGANELFDLLPRVRVTRREGVSYEPLRTMLTRDADVVLPTNSTLHVLEPEAAAERGEARVILTTPEGEPIVVRRLVGAGAVTMIGLDLSDGVLRRSGLPEVGSFWNRVLGRRGPADPQWRLDEIIRSEQIVFQRSDSVYLDDAIADEIAKTGRAAAGVLLGVIVFALYWALAGPVGYAVLRGAKRTRHAWVVFLLTGAVFTAIAWGGATALRPKTVSGEHLTFLTHVHGQPVQRARSWMSLLIPDYGSAVVRVGDDDAVTLGGRRYRLHQALAAWDARSSEGGPRGGFPDTRAYSVEARDPSSARFPARQTVKQIRADWAGATNWGGMPRVLPHEDGRVGELRLSTAPDAAPWQVEGELVHDLPEELRNVRVIVVRGQTTVGGAPEMLAASAGAFAIRDSWAPGTVLDMSVVTGRIAPDARAGRDVEAAATFLENLTPQGGRQPLSGIVQIGLDRRLTALALYGQLQPPQLSRTSSPQLVSLRSETHGLDLGRWFTEPCVIVLGTVVQRAEGSARGPVPLTVDGQAVRAGGRTVVAWVYPLPDEPPRVRLPGDAGIDEGSEGPEGEGPLRPAGTLNGNG